MGLDLRKSKSQPLSTNVFVFFLVQALAAGDADWEVACPAPNRFFETNLKPPASIIKPSIPRTTARVTMAPITPATARDMPPDDEDNIEEVAEGEDPEDVDVAVDAHTPVVFPQALPIGSEMRILCGKVEVTYTRPFGHQWQSCSFQRRKYSMG